MSGKRLGKKGGKIRLLRPFREGVERRRDCQKKGGERMGAVQGEEKVNGERPYEKVLASRSGPRIWKR